MQALYQMSMTGDSAGVAVAQFRAEQDMAHADITYFEELLLGIDIKRADLLQSIGSVADRPVSELDPVEKAILLIGTYELQHRLDVPFRVVINEAVELAKQFGASESYRFVNSILDVLARCREPGNFA